MLDNSTVDGTAIIHSTLEGLSCTTGLANYMLEHMIIVHSAFKILSDAFILENEGLEHAAIVQQVLINALAGSFLENQRRSRT